MVEIATGHLGQTYATRLSPIIKKSNILGTIKRVSSSKPLSLRFLQMFSSLSKKIKRFWGLSMFSATQRKVVLISGCLFKIIFALFMKEKGADQRKMFKTMLLLA
jgi:hypothetical protein